jgi:hypothetical protein
MRETVRARTVLTRRPPVMHKGPNPLFSSARFNSSSGGRLTRNILQVHCTFVGTLMNGARAPSHIWERMLLAETLAPTPTFPSAVPSPRQ